MKINFVLPIPMEKVSGGYKIAYEYANRLQEKGLDVVIYYPIVTPYREQSQKDLIERLFFCIRNSFPKEIQVSWFDFFVGVKNFIVPEISDLYIRDADVVVATSWTTAYLIKKLSKNKGNKYYLIQHYEVFHELTKEKAKASYFFGYQNIVISRWLKEKLENELGVRVAALIHNGIELEIFKVTKQIEKRNPFSLILMYHITDWKRIDDAVLAIKMVREKYSQLQVTFFSTYDKGVNVPTWVKFVKNPSRMELSNLYNEHSIFLSSSLTEGFGLPGLEAMACGCAVVTTDSLGVRDYALHEKTALLSLPAEPDKLAENIVRFLEDDALRFKVSKAGALEAKKFKWETAVEKMTKIFLQSRGNCV